MGLCEGLGQIFDGMVYSNDILGYTLKYFTLNERSEFTLNEQSVRLREITYVIS